MRETVAKYFLDRKQQGRKLCLLTCYDYSFAKILDAAGLDAVLVGDSLANVVLGYSSTKEVSLEEMLNHTRAVKKAMEKTFVIADMPFSAYQINSSRAVDNALRFIDEAGADCIKIEWFEEFVDIAEKIIKKGIPVMAHIGLTPQTADKLGGFKVQGRNALDAQRLFQQAGLCQDLGCFSVVLECVPFKVSQVITSKLNVPTIGIGSGRGCSGQILVSYDLLGLTSGNIPKFVRKYADLSFLSRKAVENFVRNVVEGSFPDKAESFSIPEEEFVKFKEAIGE